MSRYLHGYPQISNFGYLVAEMTKKHTALKFPNPRQRLDSPIPLSGVIYFANKTENTVVTTAVRYAFLTITFLSLSSGRWTWLVRPVTLLNNPPNQLRPPPCETIEDHPIKITQ